MDNLNNEPIEDLVHEQIEDKWGEGQLETLSEELQSTRQILARLIKMVASKNMFSEEELWYIIRGFCDIREELND